MNNLNIAYAALLHDIGKFYQRTTKISLLNSQEIASTPIHEMAIIHIFIVDILQNFFMIIFI